MRLVFLVAAGVLVSGCATPTSELSQMTNTEICNLMVMNPNLEYANGQKVLMSRGGSCTPEQYQFIAQAQQQNRAAMSALGAYGMQMQANSYQQVAPVTRPVTCHRIGHVMQCY